MRAPDARLPAVSTLIFDLGGVLVDWNPRYLYRQYFKEEAHMERFLEEVLTSEWNRELDAGKTFQQGIAERIARYPEYADMISLWETQWEDTLRGAIDATVDILRRLAQRNHRLVALSNWSAQTFPLARLRFAFLSCFEDILVSGEHGVAKPDRAIFELACRRWHLAPAQSLFIDDNSDNIATASAMGFQTVHFQTPDGLARRLRELGLLN